MALKSGLIAKLNKTIGKKYDYMAGVYHFKGWEEEGGVIIIATDGTPITVEEDMLESFLSGLIEIQDINGVVIGQRSPIVLQSVSQVTANSLSESLVKMVEEIAAAKTPEQIRDVKAKATAMSNITNSLVNMAKLELETIKVGRSGK